MTGGAGTSSAPLVSMRGITKRFGRVLALAGVDFEVRAGEVHALLGENGAGKTTLTRILAGLERPDLGGVLLRGEPVTRFDPRVLRARGVALVQQHFTLVPRFTAAENLVLSRPASRLVPGRQAAVRRVRHLAERFELPVRPDVPVSALSVGEQQRLELLRALDGDPEVLVLDEPTAVLTDDEADRLLAVCRRLADEGRAVVLITHRLREVLAGADRVTVLRHGRLVVPGEPAAIHDRDSLARAMVGDDRTITPRRAPDRQPPGPVHLRLDRVVLDRLGPLDLEVRAGEVVGVAGVDGNGQAELEALVAGRRAPDAGTVTVDGTPVVVGRPRDRVAAGVAYVPSDRYRHGLVRTMDLADNLDLGRSATWRPPKRARQATVEARLAGWDVRGPRTGPAGRLSGGNAQKLVLARELPDARSLVIACHPTRGLDPEAAATVASELLEAADRGAAVLWIGAELDELLAVADRICVLCTQRAPVTVGRPFDRHAIGLAMAGLATTGVAP